jgi:hypothetical protein
MPSGTRSFSYTFFQSHVVSVTRFADIMSVFGKIATGSLAGMAVGLHIRVDPHAAPDITEQPEKPALSGRYALIDDARGYRVVTSCGASAARVVAGISAPLFSGAGLSARLLR